MELYVMEHNRDLLFIINRKQNNYDATPNEELAYIHEILYQFETIYHLTNCVEIIDVNKFKVIKKKHLIEQVLRLPHPKAFQFINNLN
jgi:hypothetical protein